MVAGDDATVAGDAAPSGAASDDEAAAQRTYVELEPGALRIRTGAPEPVPPGWARVAVSACGLCGTDLHLLQGMTLPAGVAYPVRPGHEVAGTVVELGEWTGETIPVGTPVVLHPVAPCGRCPACTAGPAATTSAVGISGIADTAGTCSDGQVLGIHRPGGLATDVVWPLERMVPVPGLAPAQAAVLADAVATARRALSAARLPAGGALCVLGAGGVGTHVLQLARLFDASVRAVGVVNSPASADRLVAAGFEAVVGAGGRWGDLAARLRAHGRFDAVIDFSGDPTVPAAGVRLLRPGGTFVFGSVLDGDLQLGPAMRVQVRELVIAGVYTSSLDDLREVALLACSGALDLSASVTHEFPLAEAAAAFETLRRRPPGMLRVVVTT